MEVILEPNETRYTELGDRTLKEYLNDTRKHLKSYKKPKTMPPKKKNLPAKIQQKEVWAGATSITGARTGDDAKNMELICKVGQAFGIPPMGVNILGGKPYVNKDGLLYKLNEYSAKRAKGKGKLKGIKKEFIQYSLKPEDPAVMKAILEFDDGTFVEGIGEASKLNVSLDKVKASLNMMAETRAVNRAIRQHITFELWSEAMERFNTGKIAHDPDRALIEGAVIVSAEEMQNKGVKIEEVVAPTSQQDLQGMVMSAINCAKDRKTLEQIEKKLGTSDKISDSSKKMLKAMAEAKMATL